MNVCVCFRHILQFKNAKRKTNLKKVLVRRKMILQEKCRYMFKTGNEPAFDSFCVSVCVCVLLELIIIIIIFKCLFLMYRKCYLYAFRINVFLRCIKIPGNDIKENNTKIELVINSLKHVRFKRVQHNNRVQ